MPLLLLLLAAALRFPVQQDTGAAAYVDAIRRINESHVREPGRARETDLARRLPPAARPAFRRILAMPPSDARTEALAACAEAALDLDLAEDFEAARAALRRDAPGRAEALGAIVSRPRFLLRGLGVEPPVLTAIADVLDLVLRAFDDVFGFAEWSKVPGKKLRVRIHRVDRITRPPHFRPELPFHSEIDFPVTDAAAFRSPTPDGKFLFYGLCHELGHVIAMWGDRSVEEDHHAWAHYVGVVIVEHLARSAGDEPALRSLGDVRWRSLSLERKAHEATSPSLADRDGVLALLIRLHDAVGPKAIGAAINRLDRENRRLRINHVRYYRFRELRDALLAAARGPEARAAITRLLP